MKVLLDNCQWIDAQFDIKSSNIYGCGGAYDGIRLTEKHMLAIKDDERKKYVICNNCGEIIRNTKTAIASHQSKGDTSATCMKCSYMKERCGDIQKYKYVLQSNGTYLKTIVQSCNLICNNSWENKLINSQAARDMCRYHRCRDRGVKKLDSFFIKYPNAFKKLITVDMLNNSHWDLEQYSPGNDFPLIYKSKSRNIRAYINEFGIIGNFVYTYHDNNYWFKYSAKYNKIFWLGYSTYNEDPEFDRDSIKLDRLTRFIEKIYKEAK